MAKALLKASGADFDTATRLEQALIGTFLFGMIHTHGVIHKLAPPEVHALALIVFKDSLHYTDSAAAQGVQECINATKPGYHDTMNAILHRGIDGHRQYQEGDLDGLASNMISVLDQLRNRSGWQARFTGPRASGGDGQRRRDTADGRQAGAESRGIPDRRCLGHDESPRR